MEDSGGAAAAPAPAPGAAGGSEPAFRSADGVTVGVTPNLLSADAALAAVASPKAGGNSLFVGTTRDSFDGKEVVRLEYECYSAMALKEMEQLSRAVKAKWPDVVKVAMLHRTGVVPAGEASVIVAASAVHRKEAIDAVAWAIYELKARVPVWKKEVYAGDTEPPRWKANKEQGGGPRPLPYGSVGGGEGSAAT